MNHQSQSSGGAHVRSLPSRKGGESRWTLLASTAFLFLFLGTDANAQLRQNPSAGGSSETGVVLTESFLGGGGSSLSTSGNIGQVSIGQFGTGELMTSTNYKIQDSVAWMLPEVVTDNPIVFGSRPQTAAKAGGETIEIFGYNFAAPGAGGVSVSFDGGPSPLAQVASNTRVGAITTAGLNIHDNPLPYSKIEVTNGNGISRANDALIYLPSLTTPDHAVIGKDFKMRILTDPGDFVFLVYGKSIPGVAIPVLSFGGKLEALTNRISILGLTPAPSGQVTASLTLPGNPAFAGLLIEFQGLSIDNLMATSGDFTNLLQVNLVP